MANNNNIGENAKIKGLEIAKKVGFEILARMPVTENIAKISKVMIRIFKDYHYMARDFIRNMVKVPVVQLFPKEVKARNYGFMRENPPGFDLERL